MNKYVLSILGVFFKKFNFILFTESIVELIIVYFNFTEQFNKLEDVK